MDWEFVAIITTALAFVLCGPVTAVRLHRKVHGQDTRGWLITLAVSPVCAGLSFSVFMLWVRSPAPHPLLLGGAFYILLSGALGAMSWAGQYYRALLQQRHEQERAGFTGQ